MGNPPKPQVRRLVLAFWVVVVFFYFYLSYAYIRVQMNDNKLNEYLDYVVQLAGDEHRPAKEIRALILVKAEELNLPVHGDQIDVAGIGPALNVSIHYEADIDLPLSGRVFFRKSFDHKSTYHPPR